MNQQDDKHHTERPFALWDRFFFWNCDHIFSHQSSDAPITNYPSNNMVHMRSLRRLEHWRIVSVYLHQVVSLSVPCFPIEAICRSSSSCTVYITSCRCSVIGPSQDSAMACSSTQGAHNSSSVYQVEWYWCCHCYLGGPRFSTATIPTGISLGSSWIWRRGEFFFYLRSEEGGSVKGAKATEASTTNVGPSRARPAREHIPTRRLAGPKWVKWLCKASKFK